MERIKTIFLGSNWESLEILKAIYKDNRFEIQAVITPPDKPVGRKQILTPTEVKEFALDRGINIVETSKTEDIYSQSLDKYKPDLVVCIAFGEIIKEEFLLAPKYGSINIHFSILPKYRGAVPIQASIMNGEKETGITVMKMDGGMDTGDILSIYKEHISEDDTNQSLRERLVIKGAQIITDLLIRWVKGEITAMAQNDSEATYCYKKDIAKEKMEIDFTSMNAVYIERLVRASIPWPVAWTMIEGERVKIYKTRVLNVFPQLNPGERLDDRARLILGCKEDQIEILELQPEGKRLMTASQYLAGRN
ncbi:MAG TPA: methionyl-tRNA formyltransferase [Candidatus Dojkabacteria bacterium]|nr:methionyl-tRNA formyltransferase [Candidatus Dojkabacteria bacterium]